MFILTAFCNLKKMRQFDGINKTVKRMTHVDPFGNITDDSCWHYFEIYKEIVRFIISINKIFVEFQKETHFARTLFAWYHKKSILKWQNGVDFALQQLTFITITRVKALSGVRRQDSGIFRNFIVNKWTYIWLHSYDLNDSVCVAIYPYQRLKRGRSDFFWNFKILFRIGMR